jgi:hypothetical protein
LERSVDGCDNTESTECFEAFKSEFAEPFESFVEPVEKLIEDPDVYLDPDPRECLADLGGLPDFVSVKFEGKDVATMPIGDGE